MKHLVHREWEYLSIGESDDCVTRSEADALLHLADRAAPALKLAQTNGEGEKIILDGRHRLRMQQVVGVMSVPGVLLEILPKTETGDDDSRADLVGMIAMAGGFPVTSLQTAPMESRRTDLLEVVMQAFARDLFSALRPGLDRAYFGHHDDMSFLRGRLDLRRQYSHFAGRADRLSCHFDELVADTPLNRVLRAAADLLCRRTRSLQTRRLLSEALILFDAVSPLPPGPLPIVHLDRMNQRFRSLHERACLFLRSIFQGSSTGAQNGIALLMRMNTLFEAFIGEILRRRLGSCGWRVRLQAQGGVRHALQRDDRNLFAMYPDILLERGGRNIVLDTKWKRLAPLDQDHRRGILQADVYQMLAYRQAWNAEAAFLIYPGQDGCCAVDRLHIRGAERPLFVVEVPTREPRRAATAIADTLLPLLAGLIDDEIEHGAPEPQDVVTVAGTIAVSL